MRIASLRALLVDALVVGSAGMGCTRPTAGPPPPAPDSSTLPGKSVAEPAATPEPAPAPLPPPTAAEQPQTPPKQLAARYQPAPEKSDACVEGMRNVLKDLKPSQPVDYVELRQRFGAEGKTLLAHGQPCANAVNVAACHEGLNAKADAGFASGCHPGNCDHHLLISNKDGAKRFVSAAEVVAFTGPVDTAGEALLVAFANNHAMLACDGKAPQKVGKDWQITANQMVAECPIVTADVTVKVTEAGVVTVLRTENRKKSGACVGRRPDGLADFEPCANNLVGAYLASCAHLESASVPAFRRIEQELAGLGGPQQLQRRCSRAAQDERRHTRLMNRLARKYGAQRAAAQVAPRPSRSALELALDNASEGCVRETFGALVGLHQMQHAQDPEVRATLRRIARDEIRHAALAWQIAAWLDQKLSALERAQVQAARAQALQTLREELQTETPAELQAQLGMPNRAAAQQMFERLETTLWN